MAGFSWDDLPKNYETWINAAKEIERQKNGLQARVDELEQKLADQREAFDLERKELRDARDRLQVKLYQLGHTPETEKRLDAQLSKLEAALTRLGGTGRAESQWEDERALLMRRLTEATERANHLQRLVQAGGSGAGQPDYILEDLVKQRRVLEKLVVQLKKELEFLLRVYPLRTIWEIKSREVARFKRALERFPKSHPDRVLVEGLVKDHIVERDEIHQYLKEAEVEITGQLDRVNEMVKALNIA